MFVAQATADGVEAFGAIKTRTQIVGKAAQRRAHRVIHRLPVRDRSADGIPVVLLQAADEQLIRFLAADRIAGTDGAAIGVGGAAPADRPGIAATAGVGIGVDQVIAAAGGLAAFEFLN